MAINKILFINQEISPYLPETKLSLIGRELPQKVQEHGYEVRAFMPKYGVINERKNQLHEVIRLSGMNLIIDDTDNPLIIKVATLLPSRMQVYFIFNDDYFQSGAGKDVTTLATATDNDERSIFFARGTLETVKKLRWEPGFIHCNGWISALAPLYLRKMYNEDPTFQNVKIVYSLYNDEGVVDFDSRFVEKLKMDGIESEQLAALEGKAVSYVELSKIAISNSHGVIVQGDDINPEIIEYAKNLGVPVLEGKNIEADIEDYLEFYNSL
ncbi:MAG: glycogen/starch synthase [Bacteroidales bacterium]